MALAVLAILALMSFGVYILRQQTYRGLGVLDGHLNAVSIGEAGYARLLKRLESAPWDQRWFRDAPDTGRGTWEGGSYDYVVADGADPGSAELVVWATAGNTTVAMYWRLQADHRTLSPYRRITSLFFTYLDPSTPRTPGSLGPISTSVADATTVRASNGPWADDVQGVILGSPDPGGIRTALGIPEEPRTVDVLLPIDPDDPPQDVTPRNQAVLETPWPDIPPLPEDPDPDGPAEAPLVRDLSMAYLQIENARKETAAALAALKDVLAAVNQISVDKRPPCFDENDDAACGCVNRASVISSEIEDLTQEIKTCDESLAAQEKAIEEVSAVPGPRQEEVPRIIDQARESMRCSEALCKSVGDIATRYNQKLTDCGESLRQKTLARDQRLAPPPPCGRLTTQLNLSTDCVLPDCEPEDWYSDQTP